MIQVVTNTNNAKLALKREVVSAGLKTFKKQNPAWVTFFQCAIEESALEGTPIGVIVKREMKEFKKEVKDLPRGTERATTAFIKTYAETHFNMKLQ